MIKRIQLSIALCFITSCIYAIDIPVDLSKSLAEISEDKKNSFYSINCKLDNGQLEISEVACLIDLTKFIVINSNTKNVKTIDINDVDKYLKSKNTVYARYSVNGEFYTLAERSSKWVPVRPGAGWFSTLNIIVDKNPHISFFTKLAENSTGEIDSEIFAKRKIFLNNLKDKPNFDFEYNKNGKKYQHFFKINSKRMIESEEIKVDGSTEEFTLNKISKEFPFSYQSSEFITLDEIKHLMDNKIKINPKTKFGLFYKMQNGIVVIVDVLPESAAFIAGVPINSKLSKIDDMVIDKKPDISEILKYLNTKKDVTIKVVTSDKIEKTFKLTRE